MPCHDDDYDDDAEEWGGNDWDDYEADEPGDDTVPCPYCRELIHEDAQRCPHCERYVSAEDAPPARKPWWIILGAAACLGAVYWWIMSGQ
jgi:hypothetical protein